jgi:hypothetical protein
MYTCLFDIHGGTYFMIIEVCNLEIYTYQTLWILIFCNIIYYYLHVDCKDFLFFYHGQGTYKYKGNTLYYLSQ